MFLEIVYFYAMRSFLILFFIVFSIGSTIFEYTSHDFSCVDEMAVHSLEATHLHGEQAAPFPVSCHDSNCFGSAHFGHGFYCQPQHPSVSFSFSSFLSVPTYLDFNHHSLVYLDSLLRPPLA
jgi:hypothetical protein